MYILQRLSTVLSKHGIVTRGPGGTTSGYLVDRFGSYIVARY